MSPVRDRSRIESTACSTVGVEPVLEVGCGRTLACASTSTRRAPPAMPDRSSHASPVEPVTIGSLPGATSSRLVRATVPGDRALQLEVHDRDGQPIECPAQRSARLPVEVAKRRTGGRRQPVRRRRRRGHRLQVEQVRDQAEVVTCPMQLVLEDAAATVFLSAAPNASGGLIGGPPGCGPRSRPTRRARRTRPVTAPGQPAPPHMPPAARPPDGVRPRGRCCSGRRPPGTGAPSAASPPVQGRRRGRGSGPPSGGNHGGVARAPRPVDTPRATPSARPGP